MFLKGIYNSICFFFFEITNDQCFVRPTNEELVDQEKAVLLTKSDDDSEYCELDIQLYPEYKIQAFCMVCSVDKIEIFQGLSKEYLETIYGERLMEEDYLDDQLKTYRYDVELQKSGITRLTIKVIAILYEQTTNSKFLLYSFSLKV